MNKPRRQISGRALGAMCFLAMVFAVGAVTNGSLEAWVTAIACVVILGATIDVVDQHTDLFR